MTEALKAHEKWKGKIGIKAKAQIRDKKDLSLAYTPGVGEVCTAIAKNAEDAYKYTGKGNMIAVITNGTAVLGLGDIGPLAGLPVMEGKAVLFKRFANIDAFPICLASKDTEEIIRTIKLISPVFGGINLEDIAAPACFEIEERLKRELDIPVMHDDQHGTAVVVLAGMINALKVVQKTKRIKIVILGAGAAAIATAKLLLHYGFSDIILCDSKGIIYDGRTEGMNDSKNEIAKKTNVQKMQGLVTDALKGADAFIGVSGPNLVTKEMIGTMNSDAIVFAMANPVPEIMPEDALAGGAKVVATGRSDKKNQINNVLAYPGIFKGALKVRKQITDEMKIAAAEAIASLVKEPTADDIIPSVFEKKLVPAVAKAVVKASKKKIKN